MMPSKNANIDNAGPNLVLPAQDKRISLRDALLAMGKAKGYVMGWTEGIIENYESGEVPHEVARVLLERVAPPNDPNRSIVDEALKRYWL